MSWLMKLETVDSLILILTSGFFILALTGMVITYIIDRAERKKIKHEPQRWWFT